MKNKSVLCLLAIIVVSVAVMFRPDKWASSIPETTSYVLAAAWVVCLAVGRFRPRSSPVLAAVGFVVALAIFQIVTKNTIYRWQTCLSLLYWLGNFSIAFTATQCLDDAVSRNTFLRGLAVLGFVLAVIGSLQALTSDAVVYWTFPTQYNGWVVMGPFVYHNQYAAFVELALPPALFVALTDKTWRWLYLLIAATLYASVFIAGSRAGLVLTTLEIAVLLGVVGRSRNIPVAGFYSAAALFAGMVVLLAFSAGPKYVMDRFLIKDPYSMRREFVSSSIDMFRHRPLSGVGLGNWATAYPAYALFDDGLYANQAHNDWIQWAVEGGAPLLMVMVSLALWIFPRAIRSGWGCGVAAVFLHCLVDYPIQRPAVAVVFFCLLAALPADGPRRAGRATKPVHTRSEAPSAAG